MILITGGTGYIGQNLIKHFLASGQKVTILIRSDYPTPSSNIQYLKFNGEFAALKSFFQTEEVDAVVHLATKFDSNESGKTEQLVNSNILLGSQILEAMSESTCKVFINTGTFSQHDATADYSPKTLYDATKQAFEDILTFYTIAYDFKITTLKLCDVYGPNDHRPKLLQLLFNAINSQKTLDITNGEQEIRMVYIDDVCRAYSIALENSKKLNSGHFTYFIGSDEDKLTVKKLVKLYEELIQENIPLCLGGRPYHPREIMTPYLGEILPGWKPQYSISKGLQLIVAEHRKKLYMNRTENQKESI